jgi:hypothetical protein
MMRAPSTTSSNKADEGALNSADCLLTKVE